MLGVENVLPALNVTELRFRVPAPMNLLLEAVVVEPRNRVPDMRLTVVEDSVSVTEVKSVLS